jgi:hypothetical protein
VEASLVSEGLVDTVLDIGKTAVLELAQEVLTAVCSKSSLLALPASMCRIAAKTFECAAARGHEDPLAVAGGFLWLRVLSPALTSPGPAGLLGNMEHMLLHVNTRRRFLLVTKVRLWGFGAKFFANLKAAAQKRCCKTLRTTSSSARRRRTCCSSTLSSDRRR